MKRQLSEEEGPFSPVVAKKPRLSEDEDEVAKEGEEKEGDESEEDNTTTRYKWRIRAAGGYEGRKVTETIPNRAVEFLDLVNPSISITAGKHDYWESSWEDLAKESYSGLSETPGEPMEPSMWPTQGSGPWHDAVSDESGWEAYEYYLDHHGEADCESKTIALWNHDVKKEAYAARCAERRAQINIPRATKLLRATTSSIDAVDLAAFEKAFPGCPFGKDGNPWGVGGTLAGYYGLLHMNQLPRAHWGTPSEPYFAKYANHFEGKDNFSDYSLYYLDPAHPDKMNKE